MITSPENVTTPEMTVISNATTVTVTTHATTVSSNATGTSSVVTVVTSHAAAVAVVEEAEVGNVEEAGIVEEEGNEDGADLAIEAATTREVHREALLEAPLGEHRHHEPLRHPLENTCSQVSSAPPLFRVAAGPAPHVTRQFQSREVM